MEVCLKQCYHYVGFSFFNTDLAFTGKPTDSCIDFFLFELGRFLQTFNTKSALCVKSPPYEASPVSDNFYVHFLN